MNIFDKIKNFDNVLIISNQVVKEKLIDYFSNIMQLKKIIYKIPSEVSSDLLGKYDEIVRINLAKDLEESIEIADIKLENSLLLAVNQKSDNEKINELIEIRNKYKNYINKNELIENLYVDKHIILINNFNTSDEFRAALQILESINPNIKYLDTYEEKLDNLNVYEFANYKDELSYLLKKIAGLI